MSFSSGDRASIISSGSFPQANQLLIFEITSGKRIPDLGSIFMRASHRIHGSGLCLRNPTAGVRCHSPDLSLWKNRSLPIVRCHSPDRGNRSSGVSAVTFLKTTRSTNWHLTTAEAIPSLPPLILPLILPVAECSQNTASSSSIFPHLPLHPRTLLKRLAL